MKLRRAPSDALALAQPSLEPWRLEEWQRLWLAVQARHWRALAVVPGGSGGPPDLALTVAVTLARIGMIHLGQPIQVADGTQIQLSNVAAFIDEIHRYRESGELILVAVGSMQQSAVSASLAQAVDAALLCVLLETMPWSEAKETVKKIGRDHFIGSVIFRSADLSRPMSG